MNIFQKYRFRKEMKKYANRSLDISEILSREVNTNVVVDAYEFFMRQCNWTIDDRFPSCVKIFLLCVLYDGEVANGGISQFLANSSGNKAHQTADALHIIGALDAEALLRKVLDNMSETDTILEQLDIKSYNTDVGSFCYQYLMDNKDEFLAYK